MKYNPLITVIIPCFNAQLTIKRAINSVLEQTYSNIEIIIIDDNSKDNSVEIIKNQIEKRKSIQLLNSKKNIGAGGCRSIGLNAAKGDLIAFLDADDYWVKEKLEKQVNVMRSNKNIIIVITDYEIIYTQKNVEIPIRAPKHINFFTMHFLNQIATSTALFKSNLIAAENMVNMRSRQDYVFWLKILKFNKGTVFSINETLCKYSKTKDSLSSSSKRNLINNFKVFKKYMKYNYFISLFFLISNIIFSCIKKIKIRIHLSSFKIKNLS